MKWSFRTVIQGDSKANFALPEVSRELEKNRAEVQPDSGFCVKKGAPEGHKEANLKGKKKERRTGLLTGGQTKTLRTRWPLERNKI